LSVTTAETQVMAILKLWMHNSKINLNGASNKLIDLYTQS